MAQIRGRKLRAETWLLGLLHCVMFVDLWPQCDIFDSKIYKEDEQLDNSF